MPDAITYVFRDYDDDGHPLYYAVLIDCNPAGNGEDIVHAATGKLATPREAIGEIEAVAKRKGINIESVVRRDRGE